MSDERDETAADGVRPIRRPSPDETQIAGRPAADDATRVQRPVGGDDATRVQRPVGGDDATRVQRPVSGAPASGDEWAPSRANPAWAGRAEVRPQQASEYEEAEWVGGPPPREPQGRWWMPIVVGGIALVLLGVLGWGIYQIASNTSDDKPATTPSLAVTTVSTPSAAPSVTPSATTTTQPSSAPTTTSATPSSEPTLTPSTTNPTVDQVTVPALKGYPLPQAQAALVKTGLKFRTIYRNNSAAPGTVIDSDPAEGQEVPPDTTVTLVVAQSATTLPTGPITATPGK